jgi:hypothetical protein
MSSSTLYADAAVVVTGPVRLYWDDGLEANLASEFDCSLASVHWTYLHERLGGRLTAVFAI